MKITIITSLYRGEKYLVGYFSCLGKLINTQDIEILLLHNSPTEAEKEIIYQNIPQFPFLKYIEISEREGLYKTWNRGIEMAEGEYLTIWNVDDIRFPESFAQEAKLLDENPNILLTYGDYYYMYDYGDISSEKITTKEFEGNEKYFLNSHQMGCFPMWRKTLHKDYGYFDEQLKLVGDFDFQIRLAHLGKLKKTPYVLGAYLEFVPEKLSSNRKLQLIEHSLVCYRYSQWNYYNLFLYNRIRGKYNIFSLQKDSHWIDVASVFSDFKRFRRHYYKEKMIYLYRMPYDFLVYVKHVLLSD